MSQPSNAYEQERRAKLQALRELGVNPFGQRSQGVAPLAEIKARYRPEMGHDGGPAVSGAGRVMLRRDMGKLSFLSLRDDSGDLQIALDKRRLGERDWNVRDLIDLGDLILVSGKLGVTNKGEITIWAETVSMAAKALVPPPAKWEGLADVELRYRHRHVDLWANPQVMRLMRLRIRIIAEIRRYLSQRGFLEVETPMMQLVAGGAAAKPFVTHHNALDLPLYLRIAPELYLKRLLVGGFTKIFELNRNFRNEGISPRHNPEFTMLEAYEAFGDWQSMADLAEEMIVTVAQNILGGLVIEHPGGKTIHLQRPWRRVRMVDLVAEHTGWEFDKRPLQEVCPALLQRPELAPVAAKFAGFSPGRQLVEVYEKLIEPALIDPCFVTHLPSEAIPLARENPDDPYFADVYELAINGQEISPGYTELNDPDAQARHFAHQAGEGEQRQMVDQDFLAALQQGMPPAGGLGLGIDRLVMMLSGAPSIRDVILFPLMRPQG
jgi:lysyl-tRNA synthetase, class II